MGEKKPEPKYWFRKNIQDGISDDLGIYIDIAGAVSDAPDAFMY